ncbi:hypothetical protein [Mycobacteroides chelonae]|nr:hypothetical protein [Mycobacteroides chelonae]
MSGVPSWTAAGMSDSGKVNGVGQRDQATRSGGVVGAEMPVGACAAGD